MRKISSALVFLCLVTGCLRAQSENATSGAPAAAGQPVQEKQEDKSSRLFTLWVRGYNVVDPAQKNVIRLSSAQKLRLGLHYFEPPTYILTAVQAGIEQASDSKHNYGQGAAGYGKRYGANFADGLTSELLGTWIFPSIFRTDPRYFRIGAGTPWSRTRYAVTRSLITRTDSGRSVFNLPGLLGAAGSSAISNAYYPRGERSTVDMATRFGIQIGINAGFNVLREFSPELKRKLLRHKKGK